MNAKLRSLAFIYRVSLFISPFPLLIGFLEDIQAKCLKKNEDTAVQET
jgi:hypothetical protein